MDSIELRPTGDVIRAMFAYMRWADEAMLRAADSVPDEPYYQDRGVSHGSIHALLVHSMAAQEVWLRRWQGEGEARIGTVADCPTRAALRERWPRIHRSLLDFLDGQGEESLARSVRARNTYGEWFTLPLGATMLHVADHATYHRGQINTMIKQAGGEPAAAYLQRYLARSE
jgi:uncharacterized damage-inducible protein DinB